MVDGRALALEADPASLRRRSYLLELARILDRDTGAAKTTEKG